MKLHLLLCLRLSLILSLGSFFICRNASAQSSYDLNSVPISGTGCIAFGANALISNSTGSENSAIGYSSLNQSNNGHGNTALGFSTLKHHNSGVSNTAIGARAMEFVNAGDYNTAIGSASQFGFLGSGGGSYNTSVGSGSLTFNSGGSYNTSIGYNANVGATGLTNATSIGNGAIVNNSNSIQLGNSSVTDIYAGVGTNAKFITGGLQVTGGTPGVGKILTSDAVGNATWATPGGGFGNDWSITGNTGTVDGVNFIGTTDNAPFNIRVKNQQAGRIDPLNFGTFYGYLAGNINVTSNTAFGYRALESNTTGHNNIAIGLVALNQNITGGSNIAVGDGAVEFNTTGHANIGIGVNALRATTAYSNIGIGSDALGTNTTGFYNIGLGLDSDVSTSSLSNAIAIGYQAIVNASDKIVIGNTWVTSIGGYVGWSNFSDGRFKENIKNNVPGLDFILKLNPITYTLNTKQIEGHIMQLMPDSIRKARIQGEESYNKSSNKLHTGFIAQEVEDAAFEIGFDFDGINKPTNQTDNYSLSYAQFVVPLVKSVQELSKQNEELKKTIADQAISYADLKRELKDMRELISQMQVVTKTESIQLTKTSEAKLFQNAPNPFTQSTLIKYSIPSTATKAMISIHDVSGNTVSTFNVIDKQGQNIEISAKKIPAGTYIYSLIVDDILIDSKKMILTQ